MSKPIIGPWQSSKSGRRGRYITKDGVQYFQWEDENTTQRVNAQPTAQQARSQIRFDPSPPDIRQLQTSSTRPEQYSPGLPSAYAVVPGRHGPGRGPAPSSGQGYGTNTAPDPQTPYSLFPRRDDEQQSDVAPLPPIISPSTRGGSDDRDSSRRPSIYRRPQGDDQVEYTVPRGPAAPQLAPGPPPTSQGTSNKPNTTQLSSLSFKYTQLMLGDYASSEAFISTNPDILKEDPQKLLQEAVRLEKEGRHSQAKTCVQQCLLLRKCLPLSRDGRRAFFSHLKSKDKKVLNDFLDDYDKTVNYVREAAENKIADANAEANTRHAPKAPRRDTGVSEVSQRMRKVSVSNPSDRDQHSNRGGGIEKRDLPVTSGATRPDLGPRRPTGEPAIGENSTVGAPSIAEVIKGTDEEREELDPRYYKRRDAKKFFTVGRIFALLWHESAGDIKPGREGYQDRTTEGRFGQRVFSHIRRMAVVKEKYGYCVCIPINTYGGQGVAKPGLYEAERQAHSIIHERGLAPHCTETERPFLIKKPIAVNMANREQQLDKMSRINFGKPNSVEWNVKVMNVGKVAPESMATFRGYYYNEYSN